LLGVGYGNLLDDQGVELTLFFVQIVVQNRNLDTWQMPIFLTKSISEERSLLSRILMPPSLSTLKTTFHCTPQSHLYVLNLKAFCLFLVSLLFNDVQA
jgi:hypothetical protein